MSLYDALSSTYSGIAGYAQQIIAPVSSAVTSAGSSVSALMTGQTPQNVLQRQQIEQQVINQAQQQQTRPSIEYPTQQSPFYRPVQSPIAQAIQRTNQELPSSVKQFLSQSPKVISQITTPEKSTLQTITAGMKPLDQSTFGGRMSGFIEQVGQGVKNIYELPVKSAFQQIEQQKLSPVTEAFRPIAQAGAGFRESPTGQFVRAVRI